ncbi:MAG TPA: N-acetyl-gamma-glutamyl-phosphate reductase, partial [Ruminococcaceae bacterium]|nr:N-acetyl-gamma-glutamyl-phosphate reductase [Oscillospiraceae bacterium]
MTKVFIDGSAGTTGLRIYERLENRKDTRLLKLSEEKRKDKNARKEALNSADIAFLCLPDDAAKESVSLCENENTVIIDTSTAHRTAENFAYGFPELSAEHKAKIAASKRIAVPGCHASGFISLIYPLIENGIIEKSALLSCFSVTGYSGGGKKMIAEYEGENRDILLSSPRQYGIGQTHKHLPEMVAVTGLENKPIFSPVVADF